MLARPRWNCRAVLKQISGGRIETKPQADEMEQYLKGDSVVADISKLAFDLKTPLLKVLAQISSKLSA